VKVLAGMHMILVSPSIFGLTPNGKKKYLKKSLLQCDFLVVNISC
jgi:hypothetical protein